MQKPCAAAKTELPSMHHSIVPSHMMAALCSAFSDAESDGGLCSGAFGARQALWVRTGDTVGSIWQQLLGQQADLHGEGSLSLGRKHDVSLINL